MQIILRLEEFYFVNENKNWYMESGFLEILIGFLQQTEYGKKANYYYRFKDDKIQKIDSLLDAIVIIQQNGIDYYVFTKYATKTSDWNLTLGINDTGFDIVISHSYSSIVSIANRVNILINLTLNLYKVFKDTAYVGYRLAIELYDIAGYEPDNKQLNEYWEAYHIVDFISEKFHLESEIGDKRILTAIEKAPLPIGASLTKTEGLITIKWGKKLLEKKLIVSSMKERDKWIYNNLGK